MLKKIIGTKNFYKKVIAISLPVVIQQLITTSVQLVDNVMVGRLGESAISSVAVVNQLYFVVILVAFGIIGGAGIYTAQYFGSKDYEKLRESFRFKLSAGLLLAVIAFTVFSIFGEQLISIFTNNETTIENGLAYLKITRFNILPMLVSFAISSTFREIGLPKLLLKISVTTILVNTVLNYLLIFGSFGFPELGVVGAAYATLIARFLEVGLLLLLVKKRGKVFATKFRRIFKIEKAVLASILIVALPMMLNETMWSVGQTAFLKAYSTRGDSALAAFNISSAISQLVFIIFGAMSTAVAVMVGNKLGANKLEEAKDNAVKLIAFSVFVAFVSGLLLIVGSFFIPNLYDVAESTKEIVAFNIRVNGVFIPVFAFNMGLFFVIRAGGDAKSTLLMDAVFMWVVTVPMALGLAYFTKLDVRIMFLIIQANDIPKGIFGIMRYRKGNWVKNLAE